jgi:ribonuclease T2
MLFIHRLVLTIACLAALAPAEAKRPRNQPQPGQFDYYTVAHSWSPAYCATARGDSEQCDSGRQLGFVLHGLWPQYENGYPQSCSNERLPEQARAKYAPLYPSAKLVGHEWSKHGTCSGLDPAAYFALSGKLKEQLVIPEPFVRPREPVRTTYNDMVKAFRRANPGMPINSVLPYCGAALLRRGRPLPARSARLLYPQRRAARLQQWPGQAFVQQLPDERVPGAERALGFKQGWRSSPAVFHRACGRVPRPYCPAGARASRSPVSRR